MDVIIASLISLDVIEYQVILGIIQYVGRQIAGKNGVIIGFIIVLIWTLTNTYNDLRNLQLLIQGIIGFVLYFSVEEKKHD
jgi:hypothetical protein